MAYLTREDIPFHYALADSFTICDAYHCSFIGSTDPNRYYMWTGYTGNDGTGRRPGPRQRRGRLRLDDLPRAPGEGRHLLEDLPGHRRRPRRERLLGLDPGRLPRQLRRQLAALLQPVPGRQARRPAVRQGPHRHRLHQGRGLLRPAEGGRQGRQAAADLLDRRPRGLHRAPQLARELRRLVHLPGPGRAHLRPEGVGEDGPVHHLRRERRLLRPRGPAVPAAASAAQGKSTVDPALDVFKGDSKTRPVPTASASACPCSSSRPGARAAYVCSETLDHTSIIRFMESRFGVHEPNISPWRRAVCGDLTAAFDFSRKDATPVAAPRHRRLRAAGPRAPPRLRAGPAREGALPRQERGLRPARPLKYAPHVDGSVGPGEPGSSPSPSPPAPRRAPRSW